MYITILIISGQPVAVLHGANAPLLQKMIEKEIDLERKVLRGDIAREVITFEEAVPADSKLYLVSKFTNELLQLLYFIFI